MASYNEIVSILDQFATNHYQIKAFGNGEMDELVETFSLKDAEYPKMWANDQPNTTATGEETFKFRVYMVDQVATLKQKTDTTLGESNINEVKSNTRQMCLDLVSYLIQNTIYPEITTDRNIQLTSFVDSFNDKLTGWYFDLDIRQALSFSACVIPMTGITPPPSATCEPAIININGTFFINVPSGSTENIVVKDTSGTIVGSKVSSEWIVPTGGDATEIITDSASNVLYTNEIPSGTTETQIIADGTNSLNGGAISGILAQGTKSITLKDTLGVTVAPTVSLDTVTNLDLVIPVSSTPINSSPLFKTGNDASSFTGDDGELKRGGGVDFLTLTYLNKFGNTSRFTDTLGTQIYANDWVLDWSKFDQINNTVIAYYRIPSTVGTSLQNGMLSQPITAGGYADTYITNKLELDNICNNNGAIMPFNYAPFNISGVLLFSTTIAQNGAYQYLHSNGSWTRATVTTTTIPWLVVRFFTLAELGL